MAAQKPHIIHHRAGTGAPLRTHGPRIVAPGVEPNACHDVGAARRRFKKRLRTAGPLERVSTILQHDLRRDRAETDKDRFRLQKDSVGDTVPAGWKEECSVRGYSRAQSLRVIRNTVSYRTQVRDADPRVLWR